MPPSGRPALADEPPVLIWLADRNNLRTWVNQVWLDFTGRTTEQERGLGWTESLHPDDRDHCLAMLDHHKAACEPFRVEYRLRRHDGVYRWMVDVGRPNLGPDGSFQGFIGACVDITDHKEAEAALARSQRELAAVVSAIDDIILEVDEDNRFRNCWTHDERKLFLPREVFLGRTPTEVFGSEFVAPFMTAIDAVRTGTGPQALDYPSPLLGDTRWFNARISGLTQDGAAPRRVVLAIRDVTERRRLEAALKLGERRLEERNRELDTILNLSPDGFLAFDGAGRVKYASPACVRLLGREMGDLIGLDAEGLGRLLGPRCEPRAGKKLALWLEDQLAPATAAVPDSRLIELDAPRLSLEARARRNESESVPVILYFHDITERTEVDRVKSEFLSTAAHELRTPMASIYGYAELLLHGEGYDEATRREMLEIILNQAKLSSDLVNELLDLARIEARRGKDFNFDPLDLTDLVREAVLADPESLQWKWPVRVNLPERPARVLADAGKLRQALSNVLSNAYKYSPAGGEVAIGFIEAPGEVGIVVSDQGLGMTPEQTTRVCERFYRANPSSAIPGTGLGMSIVQEIVTLHRGRLDIRSAPGAGTTVTLWLPAGASTPPVS